MLLVPVFFSTTDCVLLLPNGTLPKFVLVGVMESVPVDCCVFAVATMEYELTFPAASVALTR